MSGWETPDARIIEMLDGRLKPEQKDIPLIEREASRLEHYSEEQAEEIRSILKRLKGL